MALKSSLRARLSVLKLSQRGHLSNKKFAWPDVDFELTANIPHVRGPAASRFFRGAEEGIV